MKKGYRMNKISPFTNVIVNVIIGTFALCCAIPFVMLILGSFTDNSTFVANGFTLFPKKFSLLAYDAVFSFPEKIMNAYMVTIFITVVGTILSLLIDSFCAYAVSRKQLKYRNRIMMFLFIPTLFSGGLLPYYLLMTRVLNLSNNIFAMIVPSMVSVFAIILIRTYITANLPDTVIEAARIDGATELQVFFRIVIHLITPVLGVTALSSTLGLWNEWYNAMLFITDEKLFPLQKMLIEMQKTIEYLTQSSAAYGAAQQELLKNIPSQTYQLAVVVVTIGPIILAYPYFQRYFVKGLTVGGVKG